MENKSLTGKNEREIDVLAGSQGLLQDSVESAWVMQVSRDLFSVLI